MTYFGFLLLFLVAPIVVFAGLEFWLSLRTDHQGAVTKWPILLLVLIAVLYTTPWDNYLVATGVWWYDPELVTGIVFGWVPLEEYTFFILQPILVGLWLSMWARPLTPPQRNSSPSSSIEGGRRRWGFVMIVGTIWLISIGILVSRWLPGTYLGLELAWALPPIMLQLAFGGDILRRHWKLTWMGILPPAIYLSAMDTLAISSGTWTIDPGQSTGVKLGGILPVEEFIFFLLTNVLVTFGLVLIWAPESQARMETVKFRISRIAQAASGFRFTRGK